MTKPPTSYPTFERSAELGDVVVVVRRKRADPVGKSEATPAEVDASALPLRRREGSQERQHLRPAPLKCGQRNLSTRMRHWVHEFIVAGSAHSSRRTGSVNVKVEPCPIWLFTQILPPWSSMNFRERANPSPVPSA